ncbi:MAG: DUF2326 domain-containing protein [Nanoarchaeota archaeon]|nr:DUF2326 domain-containing protein [Nanoarchaeota archaeon]
MMFLKEIYSEPEGLFDKVKFKKGINIISGQQVKQEGEKPSLNSIGKSTLISLIDFCLLSKFDKKHKLYKAKEFMDAYKIVLKVEIMKENYIIKRGTELDKKIVFFKEGEKEKEMVLDDVKRILFKKMFPSSDYSGVSEDKWFRTIVSLMIRNEKKGFDDPIEYIPEVRRKESTIYHLMLMDIDNTLAVKNYDFIQEIDKRKKELDGIQNTIEKQYGKIESINNQLDKLGKEIKSAGEAQNKFRLEESYKEEEGRADELTKQIKQLILQNNTLRELLGNYKDSYKLEVDVDPKKITSVYEEINKDLGIALKKTLEQAIEFKAKLIESRKDFIKTKVGEIEETLSKNSEKITELDMERSKIFSFLKNKEAIKDLKELFDLISEKKDKYNDLKGKISLIEDINEDYLNKKTQYSKLQEEINEFLKNIKAKISSLREIYNEVYDSLYTSKEKEGFFDIIFDKGKQAKIFIIASSQDADGFGKNRGCILVYDLTLLFNIAKNNLPYPRFWIHDGVFNGMYKNQFVSTMNLLNKKSATIDFQYIITLNEDEETIGDKKFGQLDFNIKDHIIAKFTNRTEGKIFKREF